MSEQQRWQENNTRYITAALHWLRLRLEKLAAQRHPPVELSPAQSVEHAPPQEKQGLWHRPAVEPVHVAQPTHPVVAHPDSDAQLKQKADEMAAAESAGETPPALLMLGQLLELTRFEQEILLLCIAMELDPHIAALCARTQDDSNNAYPTFALAFALFDEPRWDALSPERPLRYWRLIEINQPGAVPLTVSPLRADERIVNFVKGLNELDDRLASLVGAMNFTSTSVDEQAELPPSQQLVVEAILTYWKQSASLPALPAIQMVGPAVPSKQAIAFHVAAKLGRHLYRLPVELLPTGAGEIEALARLWQRESLLLPLALYLDMQDTDSASEGQATALTVPVNRFLARSNGIFFLGTRETWSSAGCAFQAFDVAKPTTQEQYTVWSKELGALAADNPGVLASQFHLDLATIQRIAQGSLAETQDDASPLSERLWNACLVSSRPDLDTLAQRLELKVTWDDLVLPDEDVHILQQVAAQVKQRNKVYEEWGFARKMNRGLGINALFAGESGTGKTMAAEVIAHALHLNLYRIDLSAVVSKYIGETEKNLRRLFDAAECGGAILLFDEADALFGKRSEIKDSHDRYANIEINYLLQRMEAYQGLAILATNMLNALDTAFLRRLRFVVKFSFPGIAERKIMWQKVFPPDTPTEGLDYDRLARFTLTGGSIHNVALNAAFMAAQAETPVRMPLILTATRAEFRKLDRPIIEADFKWPVAAAQGVKV